MISFGESLIGGWSDVVGRLETCGHVSALRPGLSPPCEGAG
jgi:hypothetical protein